MRDLTPKKFKYACFPLPGCPAILKDDNRYLIIGKKLDPNSEGLSERIAEDEVLLEISAELIDEALQIDQK